MCKSCKEGDHLRCYIEHSDGGRWMLCTCGHPVDARSDSWVES